MQDPNKLLKVAVESIVSKINEERLPAHAAVVKTAREMDLNVHFIKRACEVINVALTYEHFRKNASDRESDFPIVDAQKVSAEIFPDNAPTQAEQKSAWFSGSIVEEDIPNFRKAVDDTKFKAAFAILKAARDEDRVMSDQGICEKAGYARLNMEQDLENCRTELVGAKLALNSKFAQLANHWSKTAAARSSFANFESEVFSRYGAPALGYINLLHMATGGKEARGEHDEKHVAFDDCPELLKFSELMEATQLVSDWVIKTAEATEALSTTERQKQSAYRTLAESRFQECQDSETAIFTVETTEKLAATNDDDGLDPVLTLANKKAAVAKEAADKLAAGAGAAAAGLFGAFLDQYKSESTPSSPSSGGTLNNLDRKLLIQNLMSTDPILKTYEPKRVGDAYEQFMRLAPELSSEKEIVRSHLRQMVASQAMTAFDGAQLLDANGKLVKQQQMNAGLQPKGNDK